MKPLKKPFSLKVKLFGAVGIEVLFFLVVALYLQVSQTGDIIQDQIKTYGNSMATALSNFCIEDLLSYNYPALQLSVNYIGKQDSQILGIQIYHEEKIVADYVSELVDEDKRKDITTCTKCGNAFSSLIMYDPIDQSPKRLGEVKFFLSDEKYEEFLDVQIQLIWILGTLLLFGNIFASFWIIKILVLNPLEKVSKGAIIMGKGNLDHRITVPTKDEIGTLAKTLNKLAEDLKNNYNRIKEQNKILKESEIELQESKKSLEIKVQARTRELEELNKGLEGKIQDRTKELQNRITELEKFHRLTMGRENRMIELKEEIKQLKEELEKYKN
ncbi:MAG: HAMP domain-containing protein [Patescibacteria group bacterium]|nr:HAMP domain-containing protein [Patescibacteria group bacterium]